jgi:hypothetical protein
MRAFPANGVTLSSPLHQISVYVRVPTCVYVRFYVIYVHTWCFYIYMYHSHFSTRQQRMLPICRCKFCGVRIDASGTCRHVIRFERVIAFTVRSKDVPSFLEMSKNVTLIQRLDSIIMSGLLT